MLIYSEHVSFVVLSVGVYLNYCTMNSPMIYVDKTSGYSRSRSVCDSAGLRNQKVLCPLKRDSAKTFEKLLAVVKLCQLLPCWIILYT